VIDVFLASLLRFAIRLRSLINSIVFKEKIYSEGGKVIDDDSKNFANTVAKDYVA
jgi:hypothetical protein